MRVNKVVVFDLDDTLIQEIDFLKSAYLEIAYHLKGGKNLYHEMMNGYSKGDNVFQILTDKFDISFESLLSLYRKHLPKNLPVSTAVLNMIVRFKENGHILGIITDGRSISQRNKLAASGLDKYFDMIIISEEFGSEKPSSLNYTSFHKYKADSYYYIGDNIKKDFISANQLGWTTIGLLDSGENIHKQDMTLPIDFHPHYFVKNILDVESIVLK